MRSSMTKLRSTKKFEIVLDSNKLKWFYMSCAAPIEIESLRQRGLFFYATAAWIRTSVEARA